MFTTPAGDPTAAVAAAGRTWDLFRDIVSRNVGPQGAQHYGALLLTNVHGIASLESSGHLVWDKWQPPPNNSSTPSSACYRTVTDHGLTSARARSTRSPRKSVEVGGS